MKILRTPEAAFENLPDYDFVPNYVEVGSNEDRVRMHYIDVGKGPVLLLLHGQPSWSYLYRKVIKNLLGDGVRVIAPDLIGFGRSDKPSQVEDYTYERHTRWIENFLTALDLRDILMYCQDWGGMIGLRIAGFKPELFRAIVAGNTGLATGHQKMPQVWYDFKKFCMEAKRLPVGRMIAQGCVREMSSEVKQAYAAPYPDSSYCAGVRAFPSLIPLQPEDAEAIVNQAALEGLRKFDRPFITAFSDSDPITAGGDLLLQRTIVGARNRTDHVTIKQAGHFLQEDAPDQVADSIRLAINVAKDK
ncbi:MAG: haloalkane dehalogenase [Spirochaetia bacterium]|nr:haloalkane dehalogenase [Spirochaetia bacterium]